MGLYHYSMIRTNCSIHTHDEGQDIAQVICFSNISVLITQPYTKGEMGMFNRALLGNLNVMACATLINTHLGEEVPNLPNMDIS